MNKNILHSPKFLQIFAIIFMIILAIFAIFLDKNSSKNTENFSKKSQKVSQEGKKSALEITEQTREKVAKILDDAEVKKTLKRIEKSDEFYNKDGAIFLNREKILPIKDDKNYYNEWTVKTPGERDRGARRIVVGKNGEMYFTDDHYESFFRIK